MNPNVPYTDHERRVRQMMAGFRQHTPDSPAMPPPAVRLARVRMLLEEVLEFADKCAIDVSINLAGGGSRFLTGDYVPFDASVEDRKEGTFTVTHDESKTPDLVGMVDGLGDISVVNTGGFAACGVAMTPVLEAIDANNLLKIAKGKLDAGGKFIKHPDHQPPDLGFVLRGLGYEAPQPV